MADEGQKGRFAPMGCVHSNKPLTQPSGVSGVKLYGSVNHIL